MYAQISVTQVDSDYFRLEECIALFEEMERIRREMNVNDDEIGKLAKGGQGNREDNLVG